MIRVDQPRQYDLVGEPLMIAGIGTGFEAVINYRIGDGHDEVSGYINVGGGTGENAQFQKQVKVLGRAFQLDRLFVDVFEASAKDGSDLHKVTRQVLYGPHIIDGYYGFREHRVVRGETLSSIARENYGTSDYTPIARANLIFDVDSIYPDQVLRIPVGA